MFMTEGSETLMLLFEMTELVDGGGIFFNVFDPSRLQKSQAFECFSMDFDQSVELLMVRDKGSFVSLLGLVCIKFLEVRN